MAVKSYLPDVEAATAAAVAAEKKYRLSEEALQLAAKERDAAREHLATVKAASAAAVSGKQHGPAAAATPEAVRALCCSREHVAASWRRQALRRG